MQTADLKHGHQFNWHRIMPPRQLSIAVPNRWMQGKYPRGARPGFPKNLTNGAWRRQACLNGQDRLAFFKLYF